MSLRRKSPGVEMRLAPGAAGHHGVPKAGPTSNGITGKNNGSQTVPAARQL